MDINYVTDTFYFNIINRELYKTTYCASISFSSPKLTLLNKINRSHYWFPANTGSHLDKAKLLKLRYKPLYSTFLSPPPIFLDLLKLQIKSTYSLDVEQFIESPQFNTVLALLNETFRKQNFKKNLPKVRHDAFNIWNRPKTVNRYQYLNYFIDFAPHRNLSKFRKFSFLSINTWWFESKWLFGFFKMQDKFLRGWQVEHFKWRFLRIPGMSFSYWAEQQLKYNYYSYNSFDLTTDTYASKAFIQQYPQVSSHELQLTFKFLNDKVIVSSLFYWLLKNSGLWNNVSQPNYFSSSYLTQRYTYGASRLHLKNHYASLTPKYAHAYFARFRQWNFPNIYDKFHWYMHLAEPVYWNLKDGLDYHPHEFWTWEGVSWWEDNVTFNFFRFRKNRRQARFIFKKAKNSLGYYNLESVWLYKTWFHEHIFLELIASYFKSYLNFQYLSPYSRFSSEYPSKKFGHFDPKWQDRLYEYTYHHHPDYFFPSTNVFYEYYADSVVEEDFKSFLMLNFSWKLNHDLLFLPNKKKFLPRTVRSCTQFADPLVSFTPRFKVSYTSTDFILPLLMNNRPLFSQQITVFETCLVFLVNFFYKSVSPFRLDDVFVRFLYNYLICSGLTMTDEGSFKALLGDFKGANYADLANFLFRYFGLSDTDWLFHKERIVVEYTAFKRWHTLLISEHINNK